MAFGTLLIVYVLFDKSKWKASKTATITLKRKSKTVSRSSKIMYILIDYFRSSTLKVFSQWNFLGNDLFLTLKMYAS